MNTLLPTTNTTNCTTKNLKKMAAVICMTAVFVFTNAVVFAQGISNSEGKTAIEQEAAKQKWVEQHRDELNKTNAPAVVKTAPVAKEVAPAKEVVTKTQTPAVATKQVITTESAETINNAVEVKSQTESKVERENTQGVQQQVVAPKKEVKAFDPTSLPYYNYKGITNLEEAKKLWATENPDAYNIQTNTGVSQQNYPAVKPAANNGVSPNAHRRLPANYDDSKTNSLTK